MFVLISFKYNVSKLVNELIKWMTKYDKRESEIVSHFLGKFFVGFDDSNFAVTYFGIITLVELSNIVVA